jgi:hypothetical protein
VEATSSFKAALRCYLNPEAMGDRAGDRYFMGQLDFGADVTLTPGQWIPATGRFIVGNSDLPRFVPGLRWEICEANRAVGFAELLGMSEVQPIAGSRQ